MALINQDLVTDAQRNAVRDVCDAVSALNRAMETAGAMGVFIQLDDTNSLGDRNPRFIVSKHELRVMVLPTPRSVNG